MNTMSQHDRHRGMSWETFLGRRAVWTKFEKEEYDFYQSRNNIDYLQKRHYPDDCDQCNHRAGIKAQQQQLEREQEERERIRQIELKRIADEKAREANERRLMGTEDKPPPPPPPKRKATAEEMNAWLKLKQRQTELQAELANVMAEMTRIDPAKFDKDCSNECKICGVSYYGSVYLDEAKKKRHLASNKHRFNVGLLERDAYPKHCDRCDYDAKDKKAWDQHCAGKRHTAKADIQTIEIPTTQELGI